MSKLKIERREIGLPVRVKLVNGDNADGMTVATELVEDDYEITVHSPAGTTTIRQSEIESINDRKIHV